MKKLNLNFLKTLIETDFALISSSKNFRASNLHDTDSILGSKNGKNKIVSLNLQELVKSLKQTLRLIQFINSKHKSQVSISTSNKQHLTLLSSELENFQKKGKVRIEEKLGKTKAIESVVQLLLVLEDFTGDKKKIIKRFLEDKIYLVNKIDSQIEVKNQGVYKIRNSLNDFKKIVFLTVLLQEALK